VISLQNEGAEGRNLECLSGLKLRTLLASLMSVASGRMYWNEQGDRGHNIYWNGQGDKRLQDILEWTG